MASDGDAETYSTSDSGGGIATLEAPPVFDVKEIILNLDTLTGKKGVIPQDIKLLLQQQIEDPIERVGGSPSREAFGNNTTGEVYLIINTFNQPVIRQQIEEQVKFYLIFRSNKAFQNIVAPITGVIKGKKTEEGVEKVSIIGMVQKATGIPLESYRKSRGVVTVDQINTFIRDYRKVIESTGFTHGDLVYSGGAIIWDNIRIDPQTKKLYLIDYQGKRNRPENPRVMEEIDETELIPLRRALGTYFDLRI